MHPRSLNILVHKLVYNGRRIKCKPKSRLVATNPQMPPNASDPMQYENRNAGISCPGLFLKGNKDGLDSD